MFRCSIYNSDGATDRKPITIPVKRDQSAHRAKRDNTWALGPVVRSLVSANRWLRAIKTYRFPWYLTLVSTNHASSNPGQTVKRKHLTKVVISFPLIQMIRFRQEMLWAHMRLLKVLYANKRSAEISEVRRKTLIQSSVLSCIVHVLRLK